MIVLSIEQNKSADQLCNSVPLFLHMQKAGFLMTLISHRIGGNRERSLIFRKIVNDCQIKRFRLPKRQSTNSN